MSDTDDDLEPTPKPPPISAWPVAGAEGLPDDVKNGDAGPGEDNPGLQEEPITEPKED